MKLIKSVVRILCSTHAPLEELVEQGILDAALAESLLPATVEMPAVRELSEAEFNDCVERYWRALLKEHADISFLLLTDEEKKALREQFFCSFAELKKHIVKLLQHKLKQHTLERTIIIDTDADFTSSEIAYAIQLGKDTLKDEKLLRWLWNKFHNQSRIADLIGVNRSSVMRRLRTLKIVPQPAQS